MRVWLVAATLVLTATAAEAAALEYDLIWTTFARETRWAGDEKRPVAAGERSGRALARLTRIRPGVLRLEWRGEGGDGSGLIGPAGPTSFTFPSPIVIAGPPPLPHLSGGAFEFSGEPERATRREGPLAYSRGLSMRSTAAATPRASSLGVNGFSTMLCTPDSVALPMTSRVPCAVIITTRSPGRSTHAR